MSTKTKNLYFRNNQIRTKLLLFIDNEVQSKINRNNNNLKFKCENGDLTKICFEETYAHKETKKHDFTFSNVLKNKKSNNSDKSVSTADDTPNKKRDNIHSKTISGETAHPNNKILNNIICFNEKTYSVKTASKHSSTFLILSKQKNSAGYLKNLCNNLKICKNEKKPIKKCETINLKSKGLNLSQDKKTTKKSNKSKKNPKSKKENKITYSLFRKSQEENCLINPKRQMTRKSVNSVRIKFQKE